MDLNDTTVAFLGVLVAAIAPLTAFIHGRARLRLAETAQWHKIATSHLDRALDPEVPLAMRQQLLRFLSTNATGALQLRVWAQQELKSVESSFAALDRKIETAEKAVNKAKTDEELHIAQRQLKAAVAQKDAANKPPVIRRTAAGLLAGFSYRPGELVGAVFDGEDLSGVRLGGTDLRRTSFMGCLLTRAMLVELDLKDANLKGASLVSANLNACDLRGADLSSADLTDARLSAVRLEGANLRGAVLEKVGRIGATYDGSTVWPDGFDPKQHGAAEVG